MGINVPKYNSQPAQTDAIRMARPDMNVPEAVQRAQASEQKMYQAASNLSTTIGQVVEEEKLAADKIAFLEADTQFDNETNQLLYGENGALSQKGKNALGNDKYLEEFDKRAEEARKRLYNDNQRSAFEESYSRRRKAYTETLARHEFGEAKEYQKQTYEAAVQTKQNNALLNYTNPKELQKNFFEQEQLLKEYAESQGLPPEKAELFIQGNLSKTHASIVERMVNDGDDLRAASYYQKNKESFDGETRAAVEKVLEVGSTRGSSMRIVDGLLKEKLSPSEAYAKIREIENPKLRDAAMDRYKSELTIRSNLQEQESKELYRSAFNQLEQDGNLDNVPASLIARLEPSDQKSLRDYAQKKISGKDTATDLTLYSELQNLDDDEFKSLDLLRYRDRLSEGDFKKFSDLQAKARDDDSEYLSERNSVRSDQKLVKETLKQIGIDDDDQTAINQFSRRLEIELESFARENKRKAGATERQEIIDRMVLETGVVKEEGWFSDTNKRSFELDVDDISIEDRAKIDEVVRTLYGRKATDKDYLSFYSKKLMKMERTAKNGR